MQTIMLTKGQVALVDDADYAWLMLWKWKATWNKSTQSFYAYGVRDGVRCSMSRLILGVATGG